MFQNRKNKPYSRADSKLMHEDLSSPRIPSKGFMMLSNSLMFSHIKKLGIEVKGDQIVITKEKMNLTERGSESMQWARDIYKILSVHKWRKTKELAVRDIGLADGEALSSNARIESKFSRVCWHNKQGTATHYIKNWKTHVKFVGIKDQFSACLVLFLRFISCVHIKDIGMSLSCSDILRNLTRLRALSLNFGDGPNVAEKDLITFAWEVSRYQAHLEELELNLSSCQEITDKGVKFLSSRIPKYATHLKKLKLILRCCYEITDSAMIFLGSDISKHLKELKYLDLSFAACEGITDKGIQYFGSEISMRLTQLRLLKLGFSDCQSITNKGVECLVLQIGRHMVQLQQLYLYFYYCSNITQAGMKILGSEIALHLTHLKRLELSFDIIPDWLDKWLTKLLYFIPSFKLKSTLYD